jgi:hypothetical protein
MWWMIACLCFLPQPPSTGREPAAPLPPPAGASADCLPPSMSGCDPSALFESVTRRETDSNLAIVSGVDPNKTNECGQTALFHAVLTGTKTHVERTRDVDVLLRADANPNVSARDKSTALMRAASFGNFQAVKLLLDANAKVNAADACGRSPLMFALVAGDWCAMNNALPMENAPLRGFGLGMFIQYTYSPATIEALIKGGADVNAADAQGWTPLMYAATAGWYASGDPEFDRPTGLRNPALLEEARKITAQPGDLGQVLRVQAFSAVNVSKLLDAGADPLKKNAAGDSAFDIAQRRRDVEGAQSAGLMALKLPGKAPAAVEHEGRVK